jgi:limonene-1,2-epoxide hydrolase
MDFQTMQVVKSLSGEISVSARITRRKLLIAGGLGLTASATVLHAAAAQALLPSGTTAAERENVKLMKAFWAAWDAQNLDIDSLVERYMAPDVLVRWTDDAPVAKGAKAAAAAAKAGMPEGSRGVLRVHGLFAHGPLVASNRVDTIKIPGKPDAIFNTAGVAIVKNGKIVEYTDYIVA